MLQLPVGKFNATPRGEIPPIQTWSWTNTWDLEGGGMPTGYGYKFGCQTNRTMNHVQCWYVHFGGVQSLWTYIMYILTSQYTYIVWTILIHVSFVLVLVNHVYSIWYASGSCRSHRVIRIGRCQFNLKVIKQAIGIESQHPFSQTNCLNPKNVWIQHHYMPSANTSNPQIPW